MTVVPANYPDETAGERPMVILKPIALVNQYELLDFALNDEGLLEEIERVVRTAGGVITRGQRQ
ncbi:hypothetical protein [Methanosphaerula palustris]|uniref:Uncharacterized protein n=1 Tax=Methanosphaerula palustris (strain ATCC BAA-1556 / DSM 19958 / E1-9c) TaxID=521011 RepID=B8GEL4_METPE|nr:hypothetical protein [Methanosphaerula palustris]ACL17715.1 conserved hypothetical protein [Methanosphaerula palustris E1-9c]